MNQNPIRKVSLSWRKNVKFRIGNAFNIDRVFVNNTKTWFLMGYFGTWNVKLFLHPFILSCNPNFEKTVKVIKIYSLKTKTSIVEENEYRHYRYIPIVMQVSDQPTILTKQEWVINYASWWFWRYLPYLLLRPPRFQIDFRWAREIVIKFQCAFQIVKNWNFTGDNGNIMQVRAPFYYDQTHIVFPMLPIKINLFA